MKIIHNKAYAQDVLAMYRSNYNDLFTENNAFFTYNKDYFNQSAFYLLEDMKEKKTSIIRYMDRNGAPELYAIDFPWEPYGINEKNFLTIFEMFVEDLNNRGYSADTHSRAYNTMLNYGWGNGFIQNNQDVIQSIMSKVIDKKMEELKQLAIKNPKDNDSKPERHFHQVLDTYNSIFFLCPDVLMSLFEKYPDLANANELRTWTLSGDVNVRLGIIDTISSAGKNNPAFYKIASLLYTNNAVAQRSHAYETLFAAHVNQWPISVYGIIGNLGKKLGTAWLDDFLSSYFLQIQNLDKLLQDEEKAKEVYGDKKHFYDSFLIENFKALKNIILEKNKRARTPNAFFIEMALTIANRLYRFEHDIYQTLVEPVFEKNYTALKIDASYCHDILNTHPHLRKEFFLPYMLEGFEKDKQNNILYDISRWYNEHADVLPQTLDEIVQHWDVQTIEENQSTIGQWMGSKHTQTPLMHALVAKWVEYWDSSNLSFFSINQNIREYIINKCKEDPQMFRKIASTLCVSFFDFIDSDREVLNIPYERYNMLPFSNIQNIFNAYKILPGFTEAWKSEMETFCVGKTFLGAMLSALGASLNAEKDFDGHGMVEIFIKNIETDSLADKKKIFTQILSKNTIHIDESIELLF